MKKETILIKLLLKKEQLKLNQVKSPHKIHVILLKKAEEIKDYVENDVVRHLFFMKKDRQLYFIKHKTKYAVDHPHLIFNQYQIVDLIPVSEKDANEIIKVELSF